jgi:hypothetical protein
LLLVLCSANFVNFSRKLRAEAESEGGQYFK